MPVEFAGSVVGRAEDKKQKRVKRIGIANGLAAWAMTFPWKGAAYEDCRSSLNPYLFSKPFCIPDQAQT
jgi:hypothetical protein